MTSMGIDAILTPAGKRTRTGLVNEFLVRPLPSWPLVTNPQAYRLPLASRAYWLEFDVPISATGAGNRNGTGVSRTSAGGRPAVRNAPQCSIPADALAPVAETTAGSRAAHALTAAGSTSRGDLVTFCSRRITAGRLPGATSHNPEDNDSRAWVDGPKPAIARVDLELLCLLRYKSSRSFATMAVRGRWLGHAPGVPAAQ